ncbi:MULTISPECIES: YhdT family protein [Glaesserella]|uniref:DUF997 domain-containing protein n=1 Tax=Glaesserella australis TaxID=2094024 RepID=A0A328BZ25_9PAST|nr:MULTISPECIES: DUF997 family protein [Glaesserella]AUI67013.1 hypothetical protein CJD39_10720 [Glaesserella sp. 15-184]RAL18895.1 DUF997 domain-containing protein [Glaesserella australis]
MKISQQIVKEVRWTLWLTLSYVLGWVGFAYFSPDGRGLLGFPIWFELSCIYLPLLLILVTTVVVKYAFKEIDLESKNES